MAVFRHRQWVRTLSGTIGANANRPFGKNHRGKRKCVGGFASRQRGTHLQVALGYVENPPFPENCHLALSHKLAATKAHSETADVISGAIFLGLRLPVPCSSKILTSSGLPVLNPMISQDNGRPPAFLCRCETLLSVCVSQGAGKGGSLRGVAVMTESATAAETAKTVKVASWHCVLWDKQRRARGSPEPPKPSKQS